MSDAKHLRIFVEPEPSAEEMAVIAAAVLTSAPTAAEPEDTPKPNPWREAGKREARRVQEAVHDDRIR